MGKKRKHRKSYAVAAAVVIAAITFGLSVNPGSTTLAAAVEGYINEVSGTSYEIAWQTENEAEITVYLEIVENGQTIQVPKENLLLQKDDAGNWGIMRTTVIVIPPEQPPENQEEPTPAIFEVSNLVIEPDSIIAGESITVSVKVTNVGELEGSYSVVLKINDVEWGREEVTIAGGETRRVMFPGVISDVSSWGATCNISIDGLTGTVRVRDLSWFDNDIIRESIMKVFGEYYHEHVLEEIPGVAWLYKGEPEVSSGWGPYDREGDVVIIDGHTTYGEVPNIKVDYWLAKIDLDTYQVVEFYEIAE